MSIDERDRDVLRWLTRDQWQRPMDIGGSDGSHHSATLKRLAKRGLVERRRRNTLQNALGSHRGSYEYRLVASPTQHEEK